MRTKLNFFALTRMRNQKNIVKIEINCRTQEEMEQSKEAVLYHLETLNPQFEETQLRLTVSVPPIDPTCFLPDEACDIIRQTLAQSLTFNHEWTCTLHTIN